MHKWGVTRLADITRMDVIGVPVWQAIRPASKNLSVSQGKGLSQCSAQVSALMESLEMFLAESPPTHFRGRAENLGLDYKVADLPNAINSPILHELELDWIEAENIVCGSLTALPRDALLMDFTRSDVGIQSFQATSSGLAGGNNRSEAILQAMSECIERDCANRTLSSRTVAHEELTLDQAFVEITCVLDTLGIEVHVEELWGQVSLPTIRVSIFSGDYMPSHEGTCFRQEKTKAVVPALLEAIQSRLTDIVAVRDDVLLRSDTGILNRNLAMVDHYTGFNREFFDNSEYDRIGSQDSIEQQLKDLLKRLVKDGFSNVLAVDLTCPSISTLPVFFVSVPGLWGHFH